MKIDKIINNLNQYKSEIIKSLSENDWDFLEVIFSLEKDLLKIT